MMGFFESSVVATQPLPMHFRSDERNDHDQDTRVQTSQTSVLGDPTDPPIPVAAYALPDGMPLLMIHVYPARVHAIFETVVLFFPRHLFLKSSLAGERAVLLLAAVLVPHKLLNLCVMVRSLWWARNPDLALIAISIPSQRRGRLLFPPA